MADRKITEVTAKAKKTVRRAGKAAGESAENVRLRAESTVATANRIITEHPIAAAAAAVAVGAIASYLFPRTARRIGKAAPALAASVTRTVLDAAKAAQDAMPDGDTITRPVSAAADKVSRAARQAPGTLVTAARNGVEVARDAVSRSGIADQASALLDRASEGAAKAATRIRKSVSS